MPQFVELSGLKLSRFSITRKYEKTKELECFCVLKSGALSTETIQEMQLGQKRVILSSLDSFDLH